MFAHFTLQMKQTAIVLLMLPTLIISTMQGLGAATLSIAGNNSLRNQIVGILSSRSSQDAGHLDSMLREFESRANTKELREEVLSCYRIILQYSELDNSSDSDAATLSTQLLVELADPGQVKQGRRNTCALATLQAFLYRQEPSIVCETVFAAHSGNLHASDGTAIKFPPQCLSQDREARYFRPDGPYRSFASQLFQIAAANVYWQTQTKDPRGITVPRGSISYVQFDGPGYSAGDSCERLTIQWSNEVTEFITGIDNLPESSPALTLDRIAAVYTSLKHTKPEAAPALLCHRKREHAKNVSAFCSEQELNSILLKLKQSSRLPVIISVRPSAGGLRPLNTERSRESRQQGRWHVICIDDFSPERDSVIVEDFSSVNRKQELSLQDLYLRSCPLPLNGKLSPPAQVSPWRVPHLLF